MGRRMKLPAWTIAAVMGNAALQGCANFPDRPAAVSNQSKLDERIGIGAELAYTTATKLGTVLAKAGLIDRVKFKALDNDAYKAVLAVRSAYAAGNAASYAEAVTQVQAAVTSINALVQANGKADNGL